MREIKTKTHQKIGNRKHKGIKGLFFCMHEVYKQIAIKKDMRYKQEQKKKNKHKSI